MRLSVTARIALLAIGLALVSNLVLVAFVWQQVHDDAIDALRRDTIEQSDALVAVYRSGGLPALTRAIEEARAPGDRSLVIAVVDNEGRRLIGSGPDDITVTGSPAPTNFRMGMMGAAPPWSEREAGYAVRPVGPNWLVSGRLLDDWEQEQRGIESAMLLATILSLALGIGGGLVVTRYVGRRLNSVADAIEGVSSGDLSRRVVGAPGGGDAFDRLATRLNAMLDKVERLMTELRVVTDSLAHDLRSPLARLRTKTETAVLLTDTAQRDAALGGLLVETDLVMRMLTMLIEISRAESGLKFMTAIELHPLRVTLHRELITQAITNLLDNALRHGASGGEVTLRLSSEHGEMRFQVEDRGPGIADEDHERALSRFGRLDSARSTPGAGLGLSLIAAVARLHGGRFELGENAPGLVAAIIIPA